MKWGEKQPEREEKEEEECSSRKVGPGLNGRELGAGQSGTELGAKIYDAELVASCHVTYRAQELGVRDAGAETC